MNATFLETVMHDVAVWTLPGNDPRVVGIARDHVAGHQAGHPGHDSARRVVSELVTNAHIHSRSGREGGLIGVGVAIRRNGDVSVIVSDDGPAEPHEGERVDYGRGLFICAYFGHIVIEEEPDGCQVFTVTIGAQEEDK
ncbi:ATP-binding protein [Paractinoplanes durhamensis]|uniref:ATP-binding protein n=1 Tax=Paractinoplanes durhamensis TaxID=113563 RepID=UPI0031D008E1